MNEVTHWRCGHPVPFGRTAIEQLLRAEVPAVELADFADGGSQLVRRRCRWPSGAGVKGLRHGLHGTEVRDQFAQAICRLMLVVTRSNNGYCPDSLPALILDRSR